MVVFYPHCSLPSIIPFYRGRNWVQKDQVTHSKVLLRIGSTDNSQLAARMHGNYSCDSRGNVWGQMTSLSSIHVHTQTGTLPVVTWWMEHPHTLLQNRIPSSPNPLPEGSLSSLWLWWGQDLHPYSHRGWAAWIWEVGNLGDNCRYKGKLNRGQGPKQDTLIYVCGRAWGGERVHVCILARVCEYVWVWM